MSEAAGPPEHLPPGIRPVLRAPLTPRRAALLIAGYTVVATVAGGIFVWAVDREDFPTLGQAFWWALQTVTTVGYGDIVPKQTEGRVAAGLIMLSGIAFLAVITAAVTAALIEQARVKLRGGRDAQLADIATRLAAIEAALGVERQDRDQ